MNKTLQRKAVTSMGEGKFNEGASRKVIKNVNEVDQLTSPLPTGTMAGSSLQPIYGGTVDRHYDVASSRPSIPRSNEMGKNT